MIRGGIYFLIVSTATMVGFIVYEIMLVFGANGNTVYYSILAGILALIIMLVSLKGK